MMASLSAILVLAAAYLHPSAVRPPAASDPVVRIGEADAAGKSVTRTDRHTVAFGHRYLCGAWTRFAYTKLVFRAYASGLTTGKTLRRIVTFAGESNPELAAYLSARTQALLGGDPRRWRIVYRPVEFGEEVKGGRLSVFHGSQGGATYEMTGAFLVDVTDGATLDISVTPGRPVRSLEVIDLDNGDVVWRKTFAEPVETFRETLPAAISANAPHALRTVYADGTETRETCPLGNLKLMEIDK